MITIDYDQITSIVARYMRIEEITRGDSQQGYIARYGGQIYLEETAAAYDQLASVLKPLGFTPIFRKNKNQHLILVVSGVLQPKESNPWLNAVLFVLTIISVLYVGLVYALGNIYQAPINPSEQGMLKMIGPAIGPAIAYTISLLGILVTHEFGHYLAGRFHNTVVTLPYFIPFPNIFGTMGAFIQLKEPPRNRRILLDIGIAGPLAGLVVAIPILFIGLKMSDLTTIPAYVAQGQSISIEGNSLLYLLMKYLAFGKLLPAPASFDGISPLLYWTRFFLTGQPLPLGGTDVLLHPVAWAGWAGLLVTALNLVPAGQLDGGHVLYVLLGKGASRLLPVVLIGLILLGFVWPTWWLWAGLIFMFGRYHAEPLDQITQLDSRRKLIALVGIVVFILVFIPVPFLGQSFL